MCKLTIAALAFGCLTVAHADQTFFNLSGGNVSRNCANTGLITTKDAWTGVGSIEGYRGDDMTASTGTDPQTLLSVIGTPLDVNANQTNPNTFTTGGVAEFEITDPTIALNGSGTADAPHLYFYMNAAGRSNVTISYNLRDIDGSADNSIQQVALQYRLGTSGDFVNVPSAYVADASSGPNLATLVTPVSATLALWSGVSNLEFRVITTNAVGNDEWIGIDDISVTSTPVPEPATMAILGLGLAAVVRRRRNS